MNEKPIIFFDGICGLCNRTVDFIIRRDRSRIFLFSPLQGSTAKKTLPAHCLEKYDTIILKEDDRIYLKSTAVLRILTGIGGMWKLAAVLFLIPEIIRNAIYDGIAHNRFRVFGKKETCRIPTKDERQVFLD